MVGGASADCVFLGEVAQRMVVSPDVWQVGAVCGGGVLLYCFM